MRANVSASAATPGLLIAALLTLASSLPTGRAGEALPDMDFGDAPDGPYPTLLASDGARHDAVGLLLGVDRDSEADGQPTTQASGDDVAGPVSDDEDGILFPGLLSPGAAASPVRVVVSGSVGGALLNAWMDFNGDGDWTDAGEQIFTDTAVVNGINNLTFAVPAAALARIVYSRWRLSTTGGLSFTGHADDGEVEDYCHGSVRGRKWRDDNGDGLPDPGEPGLNGQRVELLDSAGTTLLAQTTTADAELDGNAGIDPVTERGLYAIHGVPHGEYVLRDAPDPNARRTFPALLGSVQHRIRIRCNSVGRFPPEEPPVCGRVDNWLEFCPVGQSDWLAFFVFTLAPQPPLAPTPVRLLGTGDVVVQRQPVVNPGVGTAVVPTEIVALDLYGNDPILGPVRIRGGVNSGLPQIPGQIREIPGGTYRVDSFFDIFTEIELDGGDTWRPSTNPPSVTVVGGVDEEPPIGRLFETNEFGIPLVVHPGGAPTDYELAKIEMLPMHGVDFGVQVTNAQKRAELQRDIRQCKAEIDKVKAQIRKAIRAREPARLRGLRAKLRKLEAKLRRLNLALRAL